MKINKDKFNLSKEYSIFAICTILIVLILSLIYLINAHHSQKQHNSYLLTKEAKNIENIISDTFNYTNHINSYIGKQIANHNAKDLNYILNLFREVEKNKNKNAELFSWSSFDWVNSENYQTVNGKLGIRKDPPNMSAREYTITAPKNPWSLQLSFPVLGNPSNSWVVPAGTGVTNDKGEFLGIIVIGFNISELTDKIERKLNNSTSFIVLDAHRNIVTQSLDNNLEKSSDYFKKNIGDNMLQSDSGIFDKKIEIGDIEYSNYQKMSEYPYVILTGFNKTYLTKEFNNLILPRTLELIGLTIFFLIILYFFKARIMVFLKQERKLKDALYNSKIQLEEAIETIKKSDVAQIEIIRQIRDEITKNSDQAFQFLEMIKYNLENNNYDSRLNSFLIQSLYQEIVNITNFATDELNKEFVDVQNIIERVVLSQEKEIKMREILLETYFDKKSPKKVFVDQIRLIQVLSGILHKTIKILSKGEQIKITVKAVTKNKVKFLAIKIADNGMGIGIKDYAQGAQQLGGKEESAVSGIDIPIETIEELVKLHGGKVVYENEIHHGSITIVMIPYIEKVQKNIGAVNKKKVDNLVYFPKKK